MTSWGQFDLDKDVYYLHYDERWYMMQDPSVALIKVLVELGVVEVVVHRYHMATQSFTQ